MKKHEILLKEENNIKEKLQNEVTKTKEQLENIWSQLNNEIKLNERINQGLKKFENEDKNINKILSYISKINKNKKELNTLLQKEMKGIRFHMKKKKVILYMKNFILMDYQLLKISNLKIYL